MSSEPDLRWISGGCYFLLWPALKCLFTLNLLEMSSPRFTPILLFSDLLEIENDLSEIESGLPEIEILD